jgi:hypothetical protein
MYKDRVQNYHLELELKSRLLIVKPDAYSFRMRFIDGLPLEIQETLMKCEHIMAEHNMIQEIIRVVYNIEESNDAFNRKYKEALKHQGTHNHDNVMSYSSKVLQFFPYPTHHHIPLIIFFININHTYTRSQVIGHSHMCHITHLLIMKRMTRLGFEPKTPINRIRCSNH